MRRAGGVLEADGGAAAQEVEVAALVGLQHVVEEETAVAAREVRRPWRPRRLPARQLRVVHMGPPVTMTAGTSAEAAPISMAGVVLSQPERSTTASRG